MPEVAVVTVQPQRIVLTTELPGRTSGYLVSEIRPQVNGLIQKRLFTEGSDVRRARCSMRSIRLRFKRRMTVPWRTSMPRRRRPTGRGPRWSRGRRREAAGGDSDTGQDQSPAV